MAQYAKYNSLGKKDDELKSPPVLIIQNAEHKQKILNDNTIVCIDIWADWCSPCKIIAPRYAELAQKYARRGIKLVKEDHNLGLSNDIQGLPTFKFYVKNQFVDSITGADLDQVEETLRNIEKMMVDPTPIPGTFPNPNHPTPNHQNSNPNHQNSNHQNYNHPNPNHQNSNHQNPLPGEYNQNPNNKGNSFKKRYTQNQHPYNFNPNTENNQPRKTQW
jgi:thioredoxin 1